MYRLRYSPAIFAFSWRFWHLQVALIRCMLETTPFPLNYYVHGINAFQTGLIYTDNGRSLTLQPCTLNRLAWCLVALTAFSSSILWIAKHALIAKMEAITKKMSKSRGQLNHHDSDILHEKKFHKSFLILTLYSKNMTYH